jgi:hypothetical protein
MLRECISGDRSEVIEMVRFKRRISISSGEIVLKRR